MNYSFAQMTLIAITGDTEETFWVQMLVLVVLAALLGVAKLIKTEANKFKKEADYAGNRPSRGNRLHRQIKRLEELKNRCVGIFLKTAQQKSNIEERVFDLEAAEAERQGKVRDLASGMEMLELDFLLGIVERPEADDKSDVMMRKLCFNELARRKQLKAADSNVLKVYAMNEGNLYGKGIQCAAMKELVKRTRLWAAYGFQSRLRQAAQASSTELQMAEVDSIKS